MDRQRPPLTDEEKAAAGRGVVDVMRQAMAEKEADNLNERLALAQERLEFAEQKQVRWWADWVKPGFILPATVIALGALKVYWGDQATTQSRFQEQAAAMTTMVNEMHAGFKIIDDRATRNIPIIEANRSAVEAQKIINDGTNDRIQNMATAIADLRRSVEAMRDAIQKTREEMISLEAKRQREGRLLVPRGQHAPTPEDDAAAVAR